jgi:hypothetical protein
MLKILAAIGMLSLAPLSAAYAECSSETAMLKASDVADALSTKLQTKPEEASKLMTEMGDVAGKGAVNEQTCSKLDALLQRAKGL